VRNLTETALAQAVIVPERSSRAPLVDKRHLSTAAAHPGESTCNHAFFVYKR